MPAFIKTDKDEKIWKKAKKAYREQYPTGKINYAIVTSIYKKMGGKIGKSMAESVLKEKLLASEFKFGFELEGFSPERRNFEDFTREYWSEPTGKTDPKTGEEISEERYTIGRDSSLKIYSDCYKCEGSGKVEIDCPDCEATGSTYCHECNGDGKVECAICGGSGLEAVRCSECNGTQKLENGEACGNCDEYGKEEVRCTDCDGDGKVTCDYCGGDGYENCDRCNGDGRSEEDCEICEGEGKTEDEGMAEEEGFEYAIGGNTGMPFTPQYIKKSIHYLNAFVDDYSGYVNESCGFHVHLSWPALSTENIAWLLLNLSLNEEMLNKFKYFQGIQFYSRDFASLKMLEFIRSYLIRESNKEENFKWAMRYITDEKKVAFHLHSYNNTLEWRGPREFIGYNNEIKEFFIFLWEFVNYIREVMDLTEYTEGNTTIYKKDVIEYYKDNKKLYKKETTKKKIKPEVIPDIIKNKKITKELLQYYWQDLFYYLDRLETPFSLVKTFMSKSEGILPQEAKLEMQHKHKFSKTDSKYDIRRADEEYDVDSKKKVWCYIIAETKGEQTLYGVVTENDELLVPVKYKYPNMIYEGSYYIKAPLNQDEYPLYDLWDRKGNLIAKEIRTVHIRYGDYIVTQQKDNRYIVRQSNGDVVEELPENVEGIEFIRNSDYKSLIWFRDYDTRKIGIYDPQKKEYIAQYSDGYDGYYNGHGNTIELYKDGDKRENRKVINL